MRPLRRPPPSNSGGEAQNLESAANVALLKALFTLDPTPRQKLIRSGAADQAFGHSEPEVANQIGYITCITCFGVGDPKKNPRRGEGGLRPLIVIQGKTRHPVQADAESPRCPGYQVPQPGAVGSPEDVVEAARIEGSIAKMLKFINFKFQA